MYQEETYVTLSTQIKLLDKSRQLQSDYSPLCAGKWWLSWMGQVPPPPPFIWCYEQQKRQLIRLILLFWLNITCIFQIDQKIHNTIIIGQDNLSIRATLARFVLTWQGLTLRTHNAMPLAKLRVLAHACSVEIVKLCFYDWLGVI